MNWDAFQSKLKLDEVQAEKIIHILHHYKDQFAELCMQRTEEDGRSPIEYAADLGMEFVQMDTDDFNNKFLNYLSNKKDSIFKISYVDAGQRIESSTREKINALLQDEQKRILQIIEINSLLDIETGYDPFGDKLAEEIIKKNKLNAGINDNHFFSKTFCILPWVQTFVDVNGDIKPCCYSTEGLIMEMGKPPLNLNQQPLREIWNSSEMRKLRRRMLTGKRVQACRICDKQTALGQTSGRELYNHRWLIADPERYKWKKRVQDSISKKFRVFDLPVYYDLRPGNTCNLKCRMCHGDYSYLIRSDPVQGKWAYHSPDIKETRFSDGLKWYKAEDIIIDEILENIENTREFYLAGGEPLINPFVKKLIDILIERKVSHKIRLQFSSNLTVYPEDFFEKMNHFESVHFLLSIDGTGPVYEYIRYPGKWEKVKHHLQKIRRHPKLSCEITATIQNYNVLSVCDLLEYAETLNIPCNLNLVQSPVYLNIGVMPQKARLLAVKRLKEYADRSPAAKKHSILAVTIDNVVLELEQVSEELYHQAIREFMIFTNDLDKSRKQSFKETLPELYNFIIEDGFTWMDEVRHYF